MGPCPVLWHSVEASSAQRLTAGQPQQSPHRAQAPNPIPLTDPARQPVQFTPFLKLSEPKQNLRNVILGLGHCSLKSIELQQGQSLPYHASRLGRASSSWRGQAEIPASTDIPRECEVTRQGTGKEGQRCPDCGCLCWNQRDLLSLLPAVSANAHPTRLKVQAERGLHNVILKKKNEQGSKEAGSLSRCEDKFLTCPHPVRFIPEHF